MNTWPRGKRRALYPDEHEAWNSRNYPGTRQLCCRCKEPTDRCEEDSLYDDSRTDGPFCQECYEVFIANQIND